MSNLAPAYVTINPSYTMPEILLPYSQASGAFDLLATGAPLVRLGEGDLAVYINRAEVRTQIAAGQSAYNELPSVSVVLSQISTPTYLMRVRAEYDHHDTAAMARRGVSIVQSNRLGMRQAHFQWTRVGLLYGFNPAQGEGLINAPGSTAINMPPDSTGADTATGYDNGEAGLFLAQQFGAIKTRTNQLGRGRKFCFTGPQRVLELWEYNVVQLVQYQRAGAGADSTRGMIEGVLLKNGDRLSWAYDDTLIGKGQGGTDLLVLSMPEVERPDGGEFNTNEFAKLAPGLDACTLQLTDMAAPREITTPLAGGATDTLSEMRLTSGWPVRPESVTLVSIQYQ
ncbi:MAG TPA: DUF2184 domain-containing protein [Rhodopila sp.]